MNNTPKKQCLECGQELFGRIDKKFCSDYCRNSYNNKLNRSTKNLIRNINNLLRKNYRILEKLNPDQKTKTTKDNLLRKGFNFDYFTSIYTTKTGNVYYFVYDQGYLELENNYYALVKRISND
jgi:predicted nucleic acid-binding Zn ribbon protein